MRALGRGDGSPRREGWCAADRDFGAVGAQVAGHAVALAVLAEASHRAVGRARHLGAKGW